MLSLSEFFIILTYASFFTVALFYASYAALLYIFIKKVASTKSKLMFIFPTISIIVPVYNEEKTIYKKIQNINELNYPNDKIEVILIDGNSTDKSADVILELSQKSPKPLTLIRQAKRNGYTKAVIEGISRSKGEIIIATDAAAFYFPDALLHLVKHFTDKRIGAVTGKEVVFGNENDFGPNLEKSYRSFYDFMRKAETVMDSTPDSKGEILAVRKEICFAIFDKLYLSPNASFDSCVPYQAKQMGYRTIYDEEAKYYEYAPSTFSDRMTQQTRRATLLIGAMILYKELLFNKNSGKFGTLILPIHFIMWIVLPIISIFGFITMLMATLLSSLAPAVVILWTIMFLSLVVRRSRYFVVSFAQAQIALLLSLLRLARRKESLYIKTIPSTRNLK